MFPDKCRYGHVLLFWCVELVRKICAHFEYRRIIICLADSELGRLLEEAVEVLYQNLPEDNEGNFDGRQKRRYRDGNSSLTTLEQKSEVLLV
jgi:hypothetical protein